LSWCRRIDRRRGDRNPRAPRSGARGDGWRGEKAPLEKPLRAENLDVPISLERARDGIVELVGDVPVSVELEN